jgi:acyl carrier protein
MSLSLRDISGLLYKYWKPFEEKNMSTPKSEYMSFKKLVCDFMDMDMEATRQYATWDDLGIDSLDFVEMIMMVEEEYKVAFTDKELDDVKSIATLHNLLRQTLESKRRVEIGTRETLQDRCSHCGEDI